MDLFEQFDDSQSLFVDNYEPEIENIYLANEENALQFISRIIPIKNKVSRDYYLGNKLKGMIEKQFLNVISNIEFPNKASLQQKLEILSDKLVEEKRYSILNNRVVIGLGGKFSSGKSKFINSILHAGEELLPEDQNPTTSIPTYIVQGKVEEINAYTNNGEKVVLDKEALQALTHHFYRKYNIGFSSFIHSLIVTEPDMPYSNIAFLDTPGYNKADNIEDIKLKKGESDECKAYEQLRKVDFLIWLMDIENGVIQQNDIEFIKSLNLNTPILIVINKIDKKTDADVEKIVSLVKSTVLASGISLYDVAAYSSLDNKEWSNKDCINQFILSAINNGIKREDVLIQIQKIKKTISAELNDNEQFWVDNRNSLSHIIANSESILEIQSVVNLYGDSLEELRKNRIGIRKFNSYMKRLEDDLNKFYKEGAYE